MMGLKRRGWDGRHRLAAVSLLLVIVCGCDDRIDKLPTQERMYAESLLVPASELGDGWQEIGRHIMARSVYGKKDICSAGKQGVMPFFEEKAPNQFLPPSVPFQHDNGSV